eukprot:GILI01009945.1.p1 GENE.GILI01009945.1~~GILI01009945.1.p1  ORF type:complete len:418 (+),score=61.55 GILI01009945.1:173-1426(+)
MRSSEMLIVLVLSLLLNVVVATPAEEGSALATAAENCNYLYAPQCVADNRCGWCCNITVVRLGASHCMDLTVNPGAYAQCGFYAEGRPLMLTTHVFPNLTTTATTSATTYFSSAPDTLLGSTATPPPNTAPSTTVAPMSLEPSCAVDVCNAITQKEFGTTTCSRCVASGSCYYCLSLSQCVGGRQYCPGGEIVNTCSPPSPSSDSDGLFGLSLTDGAIIFVVLAFVTIVGCGGLVVGLKLRRRWRERRVEEERARRQLAAQEAAAAATAAAAAVTAAATTPTPPATESTEGTAPATESSVAQDGAAPSTAEALADTTNDEDQEAKEMAKDTTSSSSLSSDAASEDVCALCYERPPCIAFLPCYHANFCQECCEKIRPAGGTYACPNCRQPVVAMVNFTQKKPLVAGRSATTISSPKK